jgi:HPt (histidine-containing phosphotransfer) domain-containing protein
MNDYLTKPIEPGRLEVALNLVATGMKITAPEERRVGLALFDSAALLVRTGEDRAFARELVMVFAQFAAANIDEIRRAVDAGDDAEIHRLAHAIKGAAANIGAEQLARHAESLESTADGAPAWPAYEALRYTLDETLDEWHRSGWLVPDSADRQDHAMPIGS